MVAFPGLEVIKLEFSLRLKFYNLKAWSYYMLYVC